MIENHMNFYSFWQAVYFPPTVYSLRETNGTSTMPIDVYCIMCTTCVCLAHCVFLHPVTNYRRLDRTLNRARRDRKPQQTEKLMCNWCEIVMRSLWNRCEIDVKVLWNRCDFVAKLMWKRCETIWDRSGIVMTSLWNRCDIGCEIDVKSLWNCCGSILKPMWNRCEIAVESKWTHCEIDVTSLWSWCEIVNPNPPNLLITSRVVSSVYENFNKTNA